MKFLQSDSEWIRVLDAAPYAESLGRETSCLSDWLEILQTDAQALGACLTDHGGLLLRGLPVQSAADFESVAAEFLPVQESYIGGVSRRSRVHNNVYNTTEAPNDVVIEQHLEATHTPRPPERIVFNCQVAPSHAGETPLASFVELFDALPAAVTDPLRDEQVVYTRELMDRESRLYQLLPNTVTQSLALSWQEVSGCDDLLEARALLEAEGYAVSLRGKLLELVHRTLARVRFSFAWQPGDVLVLDNHQMSHGRNPFTGERLILTAFG